MQLNKFWERTEVRYTARNIKIYYEATEVKTIWQVPQNGKIRQQKSKESSQAGTCISEKLKYNKADDRNQWIKFLD